jgi:hypothetical protein
MRSPRLQKAMDVREANPHQQFYPRTGKVYTANGATGCTHDVLAFLAFLWTGKRWTHDAISKAVGYPNQTLAARRRGLYPSEVQRFCQVAKIPYVVRFGMTATQVLAAAQLAPVGIGHSYSQWPEWLGYRYGGRTADGQPNGYASPLRKAGRTQLVGFTPPNDAHFGVVLGTDQVPGHPNPAPEVFMWEPNHGSAARPERPPYDIVSDPQFRRVYDSYRNTLGRTPYALVPTKSLPV